MPTIRVAAVDNLPAPLTFSSVWILPPELCNARPAQLHTVVLSTLLNWLSAAAATKSLQSCPTLCDPRDGSPPGSPVPGILQARTLEWVALSFSNALKWKVKVKSLSPVQLIATPWTAAYQAPPTMGFSRQGYWSGLPLPSLQDTLFFFNWDQKSFRTSFQNTLGTTVGKWYMLNEYLSFSAALKLSWHQNLRFEVET